jgi:hypothetical protein
MRQRRFAPTTDHIDPGTLITISPEPPITFIGIPSILCSLLFRIIGCNPSFSSPIWFSSSGQNWRRYWSGSDCWRTCRGILRNLRRLTVVGLKVYVAASNAQGSLLDSRGSRFGCRRMGAWSFNRHSSLADSTFNEPDRSHRNISKRPGPDKSHVFPVCDMAGRNGFCIGFGCERKTIKRPGNLSSTNPTK